MGTRTARIASGVRQGAVILIATYILFNLAWYFLANQKYLDVIARHFLAHPVSLSLFPDLEGHAGGHVLFAGDSHALGSGDGWRAGVYRYSMAHMLAEDMDVNVHNFGKGGLGNLGAARNAIFLNRLYDKSLLIHDLPDLDRIYYFFYEGNDLYDNLRELEMYGLDPGLGPVKLAARIQDIADPTASQVFVFGYQYGAFELLRKAWVRLRKRHASKQGEGGDGGESEPRLDFTVRNGAGANYEVASLQAAAVQLTESELEISLRVLEASVTALQKEFPGVPVEFIYLPSVATVYEDFNDRIEIQPYQGRIQSVSSEVNRQRSADLRNRVARIARKLERVRFLDATRILKQAARKRFVHGPRDNKHPNLKGYRAIVDTILSAG